MKKEVTAEYMHQLLKKQVFADVDLSRLETMSSDERREFNLAQIDSLIGRTDYCSTIDWFLGQFIEDDGAELDDNPLYDEESVLVEWYLELVSLGSSLRFHHPFDLDIIQPGLAQHAEEPAKDFVITNQALISWLRETSYRRVAAMVARIMIEEEFSRVVAKDDAVQDYYAEHSDTSFLNHHDLSMCNDYISGVLESLETVRVHRQKGQQLGLNDEQMRVTDALWGWVPHDYPSEYVEAAKEIVAAVDKAMPDELVIRSRNGFLKFKNKVFVKMESIVKKHELSVDLMDGYNITVGYLTDWLLRKYDGGRNINEQYI